MKIQRVALNTRTCSSALITQAVQQTASRTVVLRVYYYDSTHTSAVFLLLQRGQVVLASCSVSAVVVGVLVLLFWLGLADLTHFIV